MSDGQLGDNYGLTGQKYYPETPETWTQHDTSNILIVKQHNENMKHFYELNVLWSLIILL